MDEQERMLEDIQLIKSTLKGEGTRLLLPPWAYISWSLVVAAGTLLSYLLYHYMNLSEAHLALTVWVPAIIIGGVFETVGWISYLKKEELVLRAEWLQRMLLAFGGIVGGLMAIGFFLAASGSGLAGFIVISLAICFMALGSYSWKEIFYEAYILLIIGIGMLLFANEGVAATLASGIICSAGFAVAGLHSRFWTGGIMDNLYTRFDSVFFEKTRLSLMTLLFQREMVTFNTLKKRMDLSDGALYTHLEKLVKAGYAEKRKEIAGVSVQTVYFLTSEGKRIFLEYIDFLKTMVTTTEVAHD